MFFAIFWFIFYGRGSFHPPIIQYQAQPPCIQSVIGNSEILASKVLDVDQDSKPDRVVIYGNDDLNILVATDFFEDCKIVLNDYVSYRRQSDLVRSIELVEVTGDTHPELHIWLDQKSDVPRRSIALHKIYSPQQGQWNEVYVGSSCLAASTFEIRNEQVGKPSVIYVDGDIQCEWPWSTRREYALMRWNGSRFMPAEEGTVDIPFWQTPDPWLDLICLAIPCIVCITLLVLANIIYRLAHSFLNSSKSS